MLKKMLLLLIILFTTGCYNYAELNDLSIIIGIGIDYQDENYNVTLEIINDKKSTEKGSEEKAYILEGKGSTITLALDDASAKTPNIPYFAHIKTIVIDENIAKNKLNEITDYFLRSPKFRTEFYLTIAKNNTANEIFKVENEDNPIVANYIETLIKSDKYSKNNSVIIPFDEIVSRILAIGEDAIVNTISVKEKSLSLEGLAIFKDYQMINNLNNELSETYNVMNGNIANTRFITKCDNDPNKYVVLTMYNSNTKYEIKNNKVYIKSMAEGGVSENNCNYKLQNINDYNKLDKMFTKVYNNKIKDFVKELLKNKTDILAISRMYNNKNRTNSKDIWLDLEYIYEGSVLVNKKGYIFGGEKVS